MLGGGVVGGPEVTGKGGAWPPEDPEVAGGPEEPPAGLLVEVGGGGLPDEPPEEPLEEPEFPAHPNPLSSMLCSRHKDGSCKVKREPELPARLVDCFSTGVGGEDACFCTGVGGAVCTGVGGAVLSFCTGVGGADTWTCAASFKTALAFGWTNRLISQLSNVRAVNVALCMSV